MCEEEWVGQLRQQGGNEIKCFTGIWIKLLNLDFLSYTLIASPSLEEQEGRCVLKSLPLLLNYCMYWPIRPNHDITSKTVMWLQFLLHFYTETPAAAWSEIRDFYFYYQRPAILHRLHTDGGFFSLYEIKIVFILSQDGCDPKLQLVLFSCLMPFYISSLSKSFICVSRH